MNNPENLKLIKKYFRLKERQKKLKKIIKGTHVEIEWLDREKNAFKKSLLWRIGYIIKNLKSPEK